MALLSNKRLKGVDVVDGRSKSKAIVGIERGDLETKIDKLRLLGPELSV